ncbi:NAD-dependent epimerase/dehydratase family protein [Pseudoalteromonas gelatinilytica]|uniref:NAD-dependent epimerase/dehydratase family protein n=1 Tax=Pseudoalteromonas gelatinilytica TaxID=1703256 RepID=A0A3A3EQM5_9GAMM|nr:NAD-dependent epimerase/dehydratase family protein [Pseudoalteromonas profundi]RJF37993.1 NAD-dependent epimerase/dehydratase family protein [Pseudoalteromonas profundi]
MKNVLVTGGSGFIGQALLKNLSSYYHVITLVREKLIDQSSIAIGEFGHNTDFSSVVNNVDIVVHLAARAHIVSHENNSLELFRNTNAVATINLAKSAAASGVKRFVFISSIGVNGVQNNHPFRYFDTPKPVEDYAISKHEAEIGLKKVAEDTGMEVVIIRPPLVYGKNAPGNFGTLLKVANKNLPLPLGAINNRRSFVSIDNLVDIIITCIDHPHAANQTFLVSDGEDISTSNLLKKITLAAGKTPWLLPVPVSLLKFLASLVGKKATVERFSSSLTVDIEHTKKTLNWKPPITLDEGIRRCFK